MPYSSAKANGTLALTGSTQTLLPRNDNRQGLIITSNASANACWLHFQLGNTSAVPTATTNTGTRLGAGGSLTLLGSDVFTGAIAVIGTAADVVSWTEF